MSWSREPTPELLAHIKQQYEETDKPVKAIAAECEVRWGRIYEWIRQYGWRRRRDRPPLDLPPELRLALDMDRALEEADVGAAELDREHRREHGGTPSPHGGEGGGEGVTAPSLNPQSPLTLSLSPMGRGDHVAPPVADEAAPALPDSLTVADRLERQLEQNLTRVERMREMQWPQGPDDAERTTRVLERLTAALLKVRQLQNPDSNTADTTADPHDFAIPTDIDEFRHALARRIDAFVRSRRDAAVPGAGDASGADGA